MGILDRLHEGYFLNRRPRRLSTLLSDVIPANCSVLDVGCGDGQLDSLLLQERPDLRIQGVDVLVREQAKIPVRQFDGKTLPFPDSSFDAIMFVDVLHHTPDPMVLLREAVRVARRYIVIKDHRLDGFLAALRLRFMDNVGNARYGVALPYNYWPAARWSEAQNQLGLKTNIEISDLRLYPFPLDYVFGAKLHFVARFELP